MGLVPDRAKKIRETQGGEGAQTPTSEENRSFARLMRDIFFGRDRDVAHADLEELTRRSKLSSYLPWYAYDPESKLYYNTDDTVGFIWECSPLAFAGEKTIKALEAVYRMGFPQETVCQFILYGDRYIDDYTRLYREGKTRDDKVLREASEHFASFFDEGVNGLDCFMRTPIRNFRLFVSIKIPRKEKGSRLKMNLVDAYNRIRETLNSAHLYPRDLEPEGLIDWLRKIFNDRPSRNNRRYDDAVPIKDQVILSGTVIESHLDHIKIGSRHFRCATPKTFPAEVDPLQTNEILGGVWGVRSDMHQILTPFLHCYSIIFEDLRVKLHMKCDLVIKQAKGVKSSWAPSLHQKEAEYLQAVGEIDKGTPFVRILPTIWVWGNGEREASESIGRVIQMWEGHGYVMQEDRGILPVLLLSSLPFGLYTDKDNIQKIDRDFIVPLDASVVTLPVQADFSGGGYPRLLFIGRKGQVIGLDLFGEAADNHNAYIAASSGKGKSFLVNYIAENYYGSNAMIRIIDIGRSYRKLTGMFKARYLDFDDSSRVCLNPFSNITEPQHDLVSISAVVSTMCFSTTSVIPQDTAELSMSLVRQAVNWAWDREGREASIDTVHRYLAEFPEHIQSDLVNGYTKADMRKFRDLAQQLAFQLWDFTSGHLHGRWFNGPANFDIHNDELVVLELEHLKARGKALFQVVVLLVIDAVTKELYLSDRSRPRLIIFDEAWQFLKDDGLMATVIEEGFRRARKYYGSFSVITQAVTDLEKFGRVGSVIHNNTDFKFYLESEDFQKARDTGLLDYSPFEMEILKSLQSRRPLYSEIFMDTPYGRGVARLAVDPYSYYVYTSSGTEIAEIERLAERFGGNYDRAIRQMVRKYKRGNLRQDDESRETPGEGEGRDTHAADG